MENVMKNHSKKIRRRRTGARSRRSSLLHLPLGSLVRSKTSERNVQRSFVNSVNFDKRFPSSADGESGVGPDALLPQTPS